MFFLNEKITLPCMVYVSVLNAAIRIYSLVIILRGGIQAHETS